MELRQRPAQFIIVGVGPSLTEADIPSTELSLYSHVLISVLKR